MVRRRTRHRTRRRTRRRRSLRGGTAQFDIVIPVGPNDADIIASQINYTKKNIIGYRNIYLVSSDPNLQLEGCTTINENIYPFSLNTVKEYVTNTSRCGWYLQQLLKLYAGTTIPDILPRYLVIDSDTFFLRPTTFVENEVCLYTYVTKFHPAYFVHMKKLHESFTQQQDKSGICHHMMFETKYITELMKLVEDTHKEKFYTVFLSSIDNKENSGASEYELYFNYMLGAHPDKIKLRQLKWADVNTLSDNSTHDFESVHHYLRK